MRILFDKNVPVGVRKFLLGHSVKTVEELKWPPTLENGELLQAAEALAFDVLITADQGIKYQQNLSHRKLSLIVLGSNVWPIVRNYGVAIASKADTAKPGSYDFIDMPLPPKPSRGLTTR